MPLAVSSSVACGVTPRAAALRHLLACAGVSKAVIRGLPSPSAAAHSLLLAAAQGLSVTVCTSDPTFSDIRELLQLLVVLILGFSHLCALQPVLPTAFLSLHLLCLKAHTPWKQEGGEASASGSPQSVLRMGFLSFHLGVNDSLKTQ